jgi:hypothetical protein
MAQMVETQYSFCFPRKQHLEKKTIINFIFIVIQSQTGDETYYANENLDFCWLVSIYLLSYYFAFVTVSVLTLNSFHSRYRRDVKYITEHYGL